MKVAEVSEEQQAAIAAVTPEMVLPSVTTASLNSYHYRLADVFVHELKDDIPQFLQIEKLLVVSDAPVSAPRNCAVQRAQVLLHCEGVQRQCGVDART